MKWPKSVFAGVSLVVICVAPWVLSKALDAAPKLQQLPSTFPFDYSPPISPFITIQVSINADFPRPFVLDTGTGAPLLVATWAARKIELPKQGRKINIAYPRLELTEVPIKLFSVGGPPWLDLPLHQAYIADLPILDQPGGKERLAGIVGMPIIEAMPLM